MPEQTDTPDDTVPEEAIYYDQRSVALRTTQSLYFVQEHNKMSMLGLLLQDFKETQIVIVVKSKKKADVLATFLTDKDFKAIAVHGNHRQAQQQASAKQFNLASLQVILTTDMIFKTLDLDHIKLLVSYDLPEMTQEYYNRLAKMKELGVAITLVNQADEVLLSEIEFNMKNEITEKVLEGFHDSQKPKETEHTPKNRSKKPRHRKNKNRKDTEGKQP
ncbi:MAG: DEAD/DEAH box helicase [Sulfurovum sp.]|nr:DEAD/DEAH box helicase [Sulfurovum sp.]